MAIASFRDKDLEDLFEDRTTAKIDKRMHARLLRRLDALDHAKVPTDMHVPGFNFHPIEAPRYSVHVNGPWCLTFEFEGENAVRVDFEQYH